ALGKMCSLRGTIPSTSVTDEHPFLRALERTPGNFSTYLVFADWLEEQGREDAAFWRWAASRHYHPVFLGGLGQREFYLTYPGFPRPLFYPQSHLPEPLFSRFRMTCASRNDSHGFDTHETAMGALRLAAVQAGELREGQ